MESRDNELGRACLDAGEFEQAELHFQKAITENPSWSVPYYNLGLSAKFRRDWETSLVANRTAHELAPDDDAAFWNLAIAAAALDDWETARVAFTAMGMKLPDTPGPWNLQLGLIPIRVNPDEEPEVLWCHRLDPVRAQIASIPLPKSGRRFADLLLNDGAPVGYRNLGEREVPVFDELRVIQASDFQTWKAELELADQSTVEDLVAYLSEHGVPAEDWSGSIQYLCKACSEGRPHESHDRELASEWNPRREFGLAVQAHIKVKELLESFPRLQLIELGRHL